ncbi:hydrolase [Geobacter pickeringii]|uniref:Peptidase M20 domain-containing protein 2 n=2 Tax=Geobacter pickeringii TaxID=345632 RepID=A0A0B5BDN3_9BACT|nr:hydrolase [Geobacter pickeringii]
MDAEVLKREIVSFVERRKDDFCAIAEELFRNPETGLNEVRSSALLADFLEGEGYRVSRGVAGLPTAFRAEWGEGGPVVAILAEMDALPVMGHACGHNVIAAAAVGAAAALCRTLPPAVGRIVVLGTPAEEIGVGKVEMIRHGLFDDVSFALMVHPSSRRYVIKQYLGLAKVRFTFFGKPAHAAAYPEEGINALDAVLQTFNAINSLRQQLRQDVRVHGIITEGGVAPNIIPERAAAYFYVRADDLAELERVRGRVIACAEGAATATGCRLQVEADPRVLAPLRVNRAFSLLYSAQLAYLGLQESAVPADKNRGSSDIGNVSQIVPTIHPHVPIGDGIQIHSEAFAKATVSERGRAAVAEGAAALALTTVELLLRPEIREKIRAEFGG